MSDVSDIKAELLVLKAENAELRKLCADMWHELNYECVRAEDGFNGCLDRMAGFDDRMEKLGVD